MKQNKVMLFTLGNVNTTSDTRFVFPNESPDPFTHQRSQELYDSLQQFFHIDAWACGHYGKRQYDPEAAGIYSKQLKSRMKNSQNLQIDFAIQMAGHPVIHHECPFFIIVDYIPYVNDRSIYDHIAFPYFTKEYERMQDFLYREATGIICYTPVQRYLLINWLKIDPCKVTSICAGVDGFVPVSYRKKPSKTLLWVGADFANKGGDNVIEAFQRIYEDDPEYKLYMVGVNEKINCPGVTILPFLHGSERKILDELYKEAAVFVLPSYKENLGLVYLEAMARKTPVVVTSRGGFAEVIRRTLAGEVVRPGNAAEIYNAINSITRNTEIYQKYSERAYAFADKNARMEIAGARIHDAITRWLKGKPVPDDYNDYSIDDELLPYDSVVYSGMP